MKREYIVLSKEAIEKILKRHEKLFKKLAEKEKEEPCSGCDCIPCDCDWGN